MSGYSTWNLGRVFGHVANVIFHGGMNKCRQGVNDCIVIILGKA